ncbi:MAG: DnaJ C-terminal domain-containing protein [Gammaproteobacteria bacterium]|nr:DnaJ domain-containing protein [Pseudomonadales bacterium]MCP5345470.1 DnaJ domain-containing protein [Pseudomonadales bacterium]
MEFKDYYDILGVKPDDDKQAIKKAYRRLARKYHPDVSSEHDAENRFKEVSEAYEVLGDDTRRAEYDQLRRYGRKGESFTPPPGWEGFSGTGGASQQGDFSDFFETIFGAGFAGAKRGSRGFAGSEDFYSTRGRDVEIEMPVFLEDTLREEAKTIEYRLPHYDESGRLEDVKKTLRVKIPKGVTDGERIRLRNQGGPGFGDGPAGDLYLRIRLVPHPLYDVVGNDLNLTLPVSPWEAALGASVTVPTLTGKISLTIKPDSQTGTRLRVKGRGLPGKESPGDLYVILKVVMPDRSSEKDRKLWQQLADQADFNPRKNLGS